MIRIQQGHIIGLNVTAHFQCISNFACPCFGLGQEPGQRLAQGQCPAPAVSNVYHYHRAQDTGQCQSLTVATGECVSLQDHGAARVAHLAGCRVHANPLHAFPDTYHVITCHYM
jgi:hypothetical protein